MTTSAERQANAFRMRDLIPRRRPGGPAVRAGVMLAALLALPGCAWFDGLFRGGPAEGQPGFVRGFLGGVAVDDPAAALVARRVLSSGGTAVDAAVAAGFTMAVTLPSRVGLGGGGACLVFDPAKRATEAILFQAGPRQGAPAGADRPAAVPMLARGLFALHTRKSRRPFEELIASGEQLARFGTEVSRGLARDIDAVSGPLLRDPGAAAVFARADGRPRQAGETLTQPELAATLSNLRISGVGDLHQGALARRLVEVSRRAGGNLTLEELRSALPTLNEPLELPLRGGDRIAFLPPPADGGLGAAAAFRALSEGAQLPQASAQGLAAVSTLRRSGGDPVALVSEPGLSGRPEGVGASASLVIVDREGLAVACGFTLNNLFGVGRMAPGLGFIMGAAPDLGQVRPALLPAAIAYNPNIRAFRAAAAASGQQDAPMGVAGPLALHLLRDVDVVGSITNGSPGAARTQMVACLNYLPGRADRCTAAADPRGTGVALGAIDQ